MNTADLERLLAAHEAFLSARDGGERLDLTDVRIRGADLSGRNLARATFHGLFEDVRLDGANLQEATFRKAYLDRCRFDGARLCAANFRRASIETCSFKSADLREVDFTDATGGELDFRGADLSGAIFFETVFTGIKAHGTHGFWARPEDNRLETIDFSASADGSQVRDATTWIDAVHGRPRKRWIKMLLRPGTSPFLRAEPNARTTDMSFEEIPISPATRESIRTWTDRYDEAVLEHEQLPPNLRRELDDQGLALASRIEDEAPDLHVNYEPLSGPTPPRSRTE